MEKSHTSEGSEFGQELAHAEEGPENQALKAPASAFKFNYGLHWYGLSPFRCCWESKRSHQGVYNLKFLGNGC